MISEIIKDLKRDCSLEKFIGAIGKQVSYNHNKRSYNQCCPFCTAKEGFAWYEGTQTYHCFKCGEHGDYIDMIQKLHSYTLMEAVRYLSEDVMGRPLGEHDHVVTRETVQDRQWKDGLENFKAQKRQIRDEYLEKKGIDIEKINIPIGAFLSTDHRWVGGIQIFNHEKKRIGIQRFSKECMPQPEKGLGFFLTNINYKKDIYLVEGVSDYLTMLSWGVENVIGLYSITTNTEDIYNLLKKAGQSIYCLLDSDCYAKEGKEKGSYAGAKKALELKGMLGNTIKVLFVETNPEPEVKCKDINDLLMVKGWDKETFLEWIEHNSKGMSQQQIKQFIPGESQVTTDALAERFLSDHNIAFLGNSFWTTKPNKTWKEVETSEIQSLLDQYLSHTLNLDIKHTKREEIINIVKYKCSERTIELKETLEKTDRDDKGIYLENGRMSIHSSEIEPYKVSDYITSTINITTERKNMNAPVFEQFMLQVTKGYGVSSMQVIDLLIEFIGYCLYAAAPFDKIFYIYGGGGNGKSTFLAIIEMLLGEKNILNYDISTLENDKFSQYDLLGRYVNLVSDADKHTKLYSPIIKRITGGDRITASRKHRDSVTFRPFCKMIISSNYEPQVGDGGEWINRRLVTIPFTTCFADYDITPDPYILDKLANEKEAIFWHAFKGLKRLLARGSFDIPDVIIETTKRAIEAKDPICDFYKAYRELRHPISSDEVSYAVEPIFFANGLSNAKYYTTASMYSLFREFYQNNYTSRLTIDKSTFLRRLTVVSGGRVQQDFTTSRSLVSVASHQES